MGFNSAILLLNDEWHEVGDNPETWWLKARGALTRAMAGNITRFGRGRGFHAFHNAHADQVGVFVLGGNNVSPLLRQHQPSYRHGNPEDELELIRQMADERGYYLHKKTKQKGKP